ncbi:mediator of RNA polymerase II transcription subunit 1-like [Echeneis naucrates]|uniref:mediator of RNA polymerase II transcription subunit 1-like n=1 Tax=Echeneis naucrates TaxID=173247 RepID=UPI001113BB77|nr:mediator of RNA polymerase II transcription subunit 1-like [Echeneis naucrates]
MKANLCKAISDLHLKFAERSWNDTSQLVRRCMDKPRVESKPCEPLVRSMERLQGEFNVSTMNTTRSRLEMIAKQQGMGFHVTEATCYLTADLFYVEVVLVPNGGVEEVKVAPQGRAPVSSESLLQLLRSKNFADFSVRLAGLFTQYNIPGDNEIKLKLFTSLQALGKDLQQLSPLPRAVKDSDTQIDKINYGRIGCLIAGKEDSPLAIQFYTAQTELLFLKEVTCIRDVVQAAQVTVGISAVTHTLQMASVVPQPPQLDPHGYPVFLPLNEVPNETLPACFLLKLQPAVPVIMSFVNKLSQITDVTIPDADLQWAPLPKLLTRGSLTPNSLMETSDEQDTIFTVGLPADVMHTCILPRDAWESSAQRATVMESVPFTHPAHVPAILDLLRHQCAINSLLRSCATPQCSVCHLQFEVFPESDTSFSVTFHPPETDSLAVLLVNISDSRQITCRLFGLAACDSSIDQYVSTIMNRCMSIPVTLRALYSKLEVAASVPLSPEPPTTTEAENDHSTPLSNTVTDTDGASTKLSQVAAVPEDGFGVSNSACCPMSVTNSELPPEIKASAAVNPYPFTPVGVFSH